MAEIQLGTGVVWGTDGISFSTAESPSQLFATGKVMSVAFTHGGEWQEIRGQDGRVMTVVIPDTVIDIEVEIVPTGTTKALAQASFVLPNRGDRVTFTNSQDAEATGGIACNYMDGSKNLSNTGQASMKFKLRQYDGAVKAPVAAS